MENHKDKENIYLGKIDIIIKKANNKFVKVISFILKRSKYIPKDNITKALRREATIFVKSKYANKKQSVIKSKSNFLFLYGKYLEWKKL